MIVTNNKYYKNICNRDIYKPILNVGVDMFYTPDYVSTGSTKLNLSVLETCYNYEDCENFKFTKTDINIGTQPKGLYINNKNYFLDVTNSIIYQYDITNSTTFSLTGVTDSVFKDFTFDSTRDRIYITNNNIISGQTIDYIDINTFSGITSLPFSGSVNNIIYNPSNDLMYVSHLSPIGNITVLSGNTLYTQLISGTTEFSKPFYHEFDEEVYFQMSIHNSYVSINKNGFNRIITSDWISNDFNPLLYKPLSANTWTLVGSNNIEPLSFFHVDDNIYRIKKIDNFKNNSPLYNSLLNNNNGYFYLQTNITNPFFSSFVLVTDEFGNKKGFINDKINYIPLTYDSGNTKVLIYNNTDNKLYHFDKNYVFKLETFNNQIAPYSGTSGLYKLDMLPSALTFTLNYTGDTTNLITGDTKIYGGLFYRDKNLNTFNPVPLGYVELTKESDTFTGSTFTINKSLFQNNDLYEYLIKLSYGFKLAYYTNLNIDYYVNTLDFTSNKGFGIYDNLDNYFTVLRKASTVEISSQDIIFDTISDKTLSSEIFKIETFPTNKIYLSTIPNGDVQLISSGRTLTTSSIYSLTGTSEEYYVTGNTIYVKPNLLKSGDTVIAYYIQGEKRNKFYNEIIKII